MKITIESTEKIVKLYGVPARIWEGKTESGIKIYCFVTRIAAHKGENLEEFEKELQEHSALPELEGYPLRRFI